MKAYDIKCPICGTVNKQLYLEETNGWMECEHCGNTVGILEYAKWQRVPRLRAEPLVMPKRTAQ
ncbi:MAG: translation initiation factor 2 [Eubacteriales bacterium]|nr:translation initiation factor 2 [Eubacteriales bacterium]